MRKTAFLAQNGKLPLTKKSRLMYDTFSLHVPIAKQYLENLSEKLNDSAFRADMELLLSPSIEYNIHEAYEDFQKYYIEAMR